MSVHEENIIRYTDDRGVSKEAEVIEVLAENYLTARIDDKIKHFRRTNGQWVIYKGLGEIIDLPMLQITEYLTDRDLLSLCQSAAFPQCNDERFWNLLMVTRFGAAAAENKPAEMTFRQWFVHPIIREYSKAIRAVRSPGSSTLPIHRALLYAAKHGYLWMIQSLDELGYPPGFDVILESARYGRVNIIEWFYQTYDVPISHSVLDRALVFRQMDLAEFLLSKGVPLRFNTIIADSVDLFRWALGRREFVLDNLANIRWALHTSLKGGKYEILDYFAGLDPPIYPDDRDLSVKNIEQIEWLVSKGLTNYLASPRARLTMTRLAENYRIAGDIGKYNRLIQLLYN